MQEYQVQVFSDHTEWRQNGELHRVDGPAFEYANGDERWYHNGERHREDGPAVVLDNGTKFWYIDGKLHRVDGPAVEWDDGYKEWWLNDKQYTEVEHSMMINQPTEYILVSIFSQDGGYKITVTLENGVSYIVATEISDYDLATIIMKDHAKINNYKVYYLNGYHLTRITIE